MLVPYAIAMAPRSKCCQDGANGSCEEGVELQTGGRMGQQKIHHLISLCRQTELNPSVMDLDRQGNIFNHMVLYCFHGIKRVENLMVLKNNQSQVSVIAAAVVRDRDGVIPGLGRIIRDIVLRNNAILDSHALRRQP